MGMLSVPDQVLTTIICPFLSQNPIPNYHHAYNDPEDETLKKVQRLTEQWYAISTLGAVNRQMNQTTRPLKDKLLTEIVTELDKVHANETSGEIVWFLMYQRIYLPALKIYYFKKPEKLKMNGSGKNVLHSVLSNEYTYVPFTFIQDILDLNEKHKLGLLTQKDGDGLIPFEVATRTSLNTPKGTYCTILEGCLKEEANPKELIDKSLAIHRLSFAWPGHGYASPSDYSEAIKLLVNKYGADLNVKNEKDQSTLEYAVFLDNSPLIVELLLELGAKIFKIDQIKKIIERLEKYLFELVESIKKSALGSREFNKLSDPEVDCNYIRKLEILLKQVDEIPFTFLKYLDPYSHGKFVTQIRDVLKAHSKKVNWLAKDEKGNNYLHVLADWNVSNNNSRLREFCKWMHKYHPDELKKMIFGKNKNGQTPYEFGKKSQSKVDPSLWFINDLAILKEFIAIYEGKPEPNPPNKHPLVPQQPIIKPYLKPLVDETFDATTCLKMDATDNVVVDSERNFDIIRNSWYNRIVHWITYRFSTLRLDRIVYRLFRLPLSHVPKDLVALKRMQGNMKWLNEKIKAHNSRWLVYFKIISRIDRHQHNLDVSLKNVEKKIKSLEQPEA